MSSAAQILANQSNAQHSTGPVTPAGKARVSQNARKLGLFSATAFIRPEEREVYTNFRADWESQLASDGIIEDRLAEEIIQSAWRLRHCAEIEMTLSDDTAPEDAAEDYFERTQQSIDRARSSAQHAFHRALNELRRVQTERQIRNITVDEDLGTADCRQIATFRNKGLSRRNDEYFRKFLEADPLRIAKQTQPAPAGLFAEQSQSGRQIPRSAPCPCGSGHKYKRCCGKDAPAVLSRAA